MLIVKFILLVAYAMGTQKPSFLGVITHIWGGGLKPSFFMVLGSKGVCYINFGSFVAAKRRLLKLFFLQGLAEAMKIASHQDDLHEEILEATTVLCKQGGSVFSTSMIIECIVYFFMYVCNVM